MRASDARWCFVGAGVFVLLLTAPGCGDSSPESGGPLRDTSGNRTMVTGPVKRGQFHVLGLVVPKNKGSDEAILESLEPSNPSSIRGLEMRYGAVRFPSGRCRVGSARGWPPLGCSGKIRPVRGFRISSGAYGAVLVGARSQELGRWSIPAFRVRYRVGDRYFETTYMQGLGLRVVRDLPWAESSASFPAFQTEAHNIECYFNRSTESLRCDIRTGLKPPPRKTAGCTRRMTGYEMKVVGHPQAVCAPEAVLLPILRVLKPRTSWLLHGFRCYAGHSSIRCRNQVFEGFFLSKRRSHST